MVQRIKERVNLRILGLMLVTAFFIGLSLWNEPLPFSVKAQATPAVEGTSISLPVVMEAAQATALPPELIGNQEQTNGIVFGSSLLILIVVISTISVMRTRNKITKSAVEKKGR